MSQRIYIASADPLISKFFLVLGIMEVLTRPAGKSQGQTDIIG